ncbi:hypothetical protein [Bacillus xiapuensis]|uniref:Uncharacterized protein n=1 Tax=Bacillus xiapuensis TaxID=2014075 RepID=A0ABU6NCW8_9BACI|nr:hypothetical protein [Bacillus xiapuensis]
MEEEKKHGKLRALSFYAIPILLTIVLVVVVVNFLGIPVGKTLQSWGSKIPVLNMIIPDPKTESVSTATQSNGQDVWRQKYLNSSLALKDQDKTIADLKKQLNSNLTKVYDLKKSNDELKRQLKTKQTQQFLAQKRQVSSVYADIPPSKAGAMFEAMTLEDASLTMSMLDPPLQSSILGGMKDSKKAAQISMLVKDIGMLNEPTQETLKKKVHSMVKKYETPMDTLAETLAGMQPTQAAGIIQSMLQTNAQMAMNLLKNLNTSNRSQILAEIAKKDAKLAAQITASLNN